MRFAFRLTQGISEALFPILKIEVTVLFDYCLTSNNPIIE